MTHEKGDRRRGTARGLALFIGGFTLLNLLGDLRAAYFDANHWWIDLSPLPPAVGAIVLAALGVALIAYAVVPRARVWRRAMTGGLAIGAGGAALINAVRFYQLRLHGDIHKSFFIPFSLLIVAALAVVILSVYSNRPHHTRGRERWVIAGVFVACLFVFPLAQMVCFGKTDYRRPADAIVVFGARVYEDGRASQALEDRVRQACELYNTGLAKKIIFSGGPGDGEVNEPQASKTLALKWGVKEEDIILDPYGVNTDATVRNTVNLFTDMGIRRVMAVSHFYHLPRVKMSYERHGWEVYTVPVPEVLAGTPKFMVREVAALWVYYLRPLRPGHASVEAR